MIRFSFPIKHCTACTEPFWNLISLNLVGVPKSVRISQIFIYGNAWQKVCKVEQNWCGKYACVLQETCLTGPLEYKYRFGHYLYSTKCSWIIYISILSGSDEIWPYYSFQKHYSITIYPLSQCVCCTDTCTVICNVK